MRPNVQTSWSNGTEFRSGKPIASSPAGLRPAKTTERAERYGHCAFATAKLRRLRALCIVLIGVVSLLVIAACGQSGPLVLPTESASAPAAGTEPGAEPSADEDEDENER